jgi:hypothetical protein
MVRSDHQVGSNLLNLKARWGAHHLQPDSPAYRTPQDVGVDWKYPEIPTSCCSIDAPAVGNISMNYAPLLLDVDLTTCYSWPCLVMRLTASPLCDPSFSFHIDEPASPVSPFCVVVHGRAFRWELSV